MRKLTLVLIVFAMGAMLSQAEVLSKNAVGYVKVTVEPGELAIITQPFLPIDPADDPIPSNVFGDSLPVDSRLWVWDGASYQVETYSESTEPFPPFNIVTNWFPDAALLEPGAGFWVTIPAAAPDAVDVFVMGEVPDVATTDVPLIEGLVMVSFPYPAAMKVEDLAMAQDPQLNDRIWIWGLGGGQGYSVVTYSEQTEPFPPFNVVTNWFPADVEIPPGMGFWYQSGATRTPTEVKPYTWP